VFSLALYFRLISIHLRSQLQYRASFLLDVLGQALVTLIGFITLSAVIQRFGTIGGWRLGEIAFLYGLVEVSFATMDMVFSGFDPETFSQHVRRGSFDQLLLRPVNLPLQVFASEFVLRRLGRMAQGAAVFIIGVQLAQVDWTLAKLLYLPVVYVSTVAFFGGLFVMGAALCFWTVQSSEAINIFTYGGAEMMAYPMHIYAPGLRRIFTYLIPAGLMVYYPALYFLDKPDPLGLPQLLSFAAPLAGAAVLTFGLAFWRLGVTRYTSTGT
jgi:ABC-2 type transport system permease protein